MYMRSKLAHIEKIEWMRPIEGKDRIVLAGVLGWQVVVNKEDYSVGDMVVFCEIDSVLPQKTEYDFMKRYNYRVRTIKMGGVYSQGLCLPLSVLPKKNYSIGEDVTNLIGIKHREKLERKKDSGLFADG
jgi:RNA ligase (TIGR02306 family)